MSKHSDKKYQSETPELIESNIQIPQNVIQQIPIPQIIQSPPVFLNGQCQIHHTQPSVKYVLRPYNELQKQTYPEQNLQLKIESLLNQNSQKQQIDDLKQTVNELKASLKQNYYPNDEHNNLFKLEKKLSKKKDKIKQLKVEIEILKKELEKKNRFLHEQEFKNKNQFIPQPPVFTQPQPEYIRIPTPDYRLEMINQDLQCELQAILQQRDILKEQNAYLENERIKIINEFNRVVEELRRSQVDYQKLSEIILQKDELIRSLEQRIAIEVNRQQILLKQEGTPTKIHLSTTNYEKGQTVYPTLISTLQG